MNKRFTLEDCIGNDKAHSVRNELKKIIDEAVINIPFYDRVKVRIEIENILVRWNNV